MPEQRNESSAATGLHSWCEHDRYRNALQRIAEGPSDVTLTGIQVFARKVLNG